MQNRLFLNVTLCWLILALPGVSFAEEQDRVKQKIMAEESFSGTQLVFTPQEPIHNMTLTISGPQQFQASLFSEYDIPTIELWNYGEVNDGLYKYQLTGASNEKVEIENTDMLDNGRDRENNYLRFKSISQSGHFRVKNGEIIAKETAQESEGGDGHDQIQ